MNLTALIKGQANKSALGKRTYGWARWKWHVLRDNWGALVWTRTHETTTPLGFKLSAGLHPAYEQMRNGTFEPDETALITRLPQRVDRGDRAPASQPPQSLSEPDFQRVGS